MPGVYGLKEMVAKKMSKIGDYFASQCGNPHGVIGKIMTWAMNRANNVMYKGIVDELKISPKTRILDVGFGNGYLETLIIQKSRHISCKLAKLFSAVFKYLKQSCTCKLSVTCT